GWDETIRLWDARTGRERHRLVGHQEPVRSVVLSPDGKTLASFGGRSWPADGSLRLWDVGRARGLRELPRVKRGMPELAFSPDGRTLAAASEGAVCFLGVATGQERYRTSRAPGEVCSLAVAPDGRSFAWGNSASELRLGDFTTGKERRRFA